MNQICALGVLASVLLSACAADSSSDIESISGDSHIPAQADRASEVRPVRATDGPFGVSQGMSLEEVTELLGRPLDGSEGTAYFFSSAPKKHPSLQNYVIVISDQHGVCKITGFGEVDTNRFGTQLRSEVDSLEKSLSAKYGQPSDSVDRVLPGSLWTDPEDFMMGLIQKDRSLMYIWSAKDGERMPNDIATIGLSATALSTDRGAISLGYEFENFSQCIEEHRAKVSEAL